MPAWEALSGCGPGCDITSGFCWIFAVFYMQFFLGIVTSGCSHPWSSSLIPSCQCLTIEHHRADIVFSCSTKGGTFLWQPFSRSDFLASENTVIPPFNRCQFNRLKLKIIIFEVYRCPLNLPLQSFSEVPRKLLNVRRGLGADLMIFQGLLDVCVTADDATFVSYLE